MLGDKYILEPEAILDHSVQAEGKRWYLVKWKPKWVKKHELPPGVYDKWEERKAKRAKLDPEAAAKLDDDEEENEEEGFRILDERQVAPGDGEDGENGEDDDDDDEEEDDEDDDDDEELNGDIEIKEEEDDGEYEANGEVDHEELNTLSSIDRDIVLNGLPDDVKDEIKEEEEANGEISIPNDYTKPYS